MLLWKADRDMEAGEVRVIAYRSRKTSKLIATDKGYQFQFNNHYGSPVLENFFLVVPLNISIVEQSREYTTRKKFDICEIYHWQKENPANTTNKVDVVLAQSEVLMQDYAESVPVDELIKSGKVPSFKTQIYDNSGLDLETGVSVPFMDEWPALCDVTWDNDEGGALMIKPKSSVRFIALGAAENWEDAISMARNSLGVLRTSTSKGMFASQSKFAAVLTSEGNLAVIQISEHDANKGTIYGWVEKIPAWIRSFGPVIERVINDNGEEKNWLIDFETGRLFSPSTETRSDEVFSRWITENRIDAMGETRTSSPGLYGFEMEAIPIAAETWETISPKGLADALSIAKSGIRTVMSAKGKLPLTYTFKTREGGMGVVQILQMQYKKKPRFFRIRYKMLQRETQNTAIANSLSVSEAFLAAAVSGRDSEAIRLVKPGSAVAVQVKDFQKIYEKDKLKVVSVYGDEEAALAITTEVRVGPDEKGQLSIRLIKQRGNWMVEDVDCETPASLKIEIDSFLQRHPNATKLQ
jgi:hypothetical protein